MNIENEILGFDPTKLSIFAEPEQKSGNFVSNIYRPRPADSKSTDGIYRATIRVLYSPWNVQRSILERTSYAMQDAQGFFQVVSKLTDNDTSCPIFSAWKTCHFSKDPMLQMQATTKDKGGNGMFDRRYERYVTIQVIDDQNNQDLNGQYMLWKLPKFVYEAITTKMRPAAESNKASIPVMDPLFGRAIYLEVKPGPDDPQAPERKLREISYSTTEISDDIMPCTNPDGSSMLNAEEQAVLDTYINEMNKVWKSRNADERQKLSAEIANNDNTKKLSVIYNNVIEKMKEFCPNLIDELGYKPWSEETTARVNNWIAAVLAGKNPSASIPTPGGGIPAADPLAVPTAAPTVAPSPTPTPAADASSDLPF